MGTNYYLRSDECKACGRGNDLHIGKSSGGWCFTLATHTEPRIDSLDDWLRLFNTRGNLIYDEYGTCIDWKDMVKTILVREQIPEPDRSSGWYMTNHARLGPHGLVRHKLDSFCMKHGGGTYDLVHPDKDFC